MLNLRDGRIPVRFGPPGAAGPDEALLVEAEGDLPGGRVGARFAGGRPGHSMGCACCAPRGAVATALHRLFLARARGEAGWFSGVLVSASPAGEAAVRQALAEDSFLSGRYRAAG